MNTLHAAAGYFCSIEKQITFINTAEMFRTVERLGTFNHNYSVYKNECASAQKAGQNLSCNASASHSGRIRFESRTGTGYPKIVLCISSVAPDEYSDSAITQIITDSFHLPFGS
jgi:hypothetical protein